MLCIEQFHTQVNYTIVLTSRAQFSENPHIQYWAESLNLQQHCRLDMKNALEKTEHSHSYLYVHHDQSLLYNVVKQQRRQLYQQLYV